MLHKAFLRRALPHYQGSDVPCVKWNLSEVQEQFWPFALPAATNIHTGDIIIIIIIIIIISDVAVSTSVCQAVLFRARRSVVARPRLSGCKSFSIVRNQVCLDWPCLLLQCFGRPVVLAYSARE